MCAFASSSGLAVEIATSPVSPGVPARLNLIVSAAHRIFQFVTPIKRISETRDIRRNAPSWRRYSNFKSLATDLHSAPGLDKFAPAAGVISVQASCGNFCAQSVSLCALAVAPVAVRQLLF